jgi:hypothetical protein
MALFGPDPAEVAAEIQATAKREQEASIADALAQARFATTEGQGISTAANIDLSLDDPEAFANGELGEDPLEGLFI